MDRARLCRVSGLLLILVLQSLHHGLPHAHPAPSSAVSSVMHHHHADGHAHGHHHHHDPADRETAPPEPGENWLAAILDAHTHSSHTHDLFPVSPGLQFGGKIINNLFNAAAVVHEWPEPAVVTTWRTRTIAHPPPRHVTTAYLACRALRAPPVLG